MYQVDLYAKARRAVMLENQSERTTAKRLGISRKTASKMLRHMYRRVANEKTRRYHRNTPPSLACRRATKIDRVD